jgi:hypothetical protein
MPWMQPAPKNFRYFPTPGSEEEPATLTSYPDSWWSEEFWSALRDAAKYRQQIEKFKIAPWDDAQTSAELAELLKKQQSAELVVRRPEILEEAEGPPSYYSRMMFLDSRRPTTHALVFGCIAWAVPFIMYFKHEFKRPRPTQLEPRLRPVVDVPQHPAYPSGHSTQSHLVALLMRAVSGRADVESALWSAADRIAENREYAGLHYPSDSACGVELAKLIAPIFIQENQPMITSARKAEWS